METKLTGLQKATLRASEIRARLAELGGSDELSDEESGELDELRSEYQTTERKIQALTIAEDIPTETRAADPEKRETTETAEDRELRELRGKLDFGRYVGTAFKQSALDGAEAEYNQHLGIGLDRFPLELLAPATEERAKADGDTQSNASSWIDRLFADTAAMSLGVTCRPLPLASRPIPCLAARPIPCNAGASRRRRSPR